MSGWQIIWRADLPGVLASDSSNRYPFCFSHAEKAEIERNLSGSLLGMQAMQSIQETLGDLFPEQGVVRAEQNDEAKNALGQAKEYIIEQFAKDDDDQKEWEEEWPFDD